MQIKEIIESYLKQIDEKNDKLLNEENTSILLGNFYKTSIDELETILEKDVKQADKCLKEELINTLTLNLKDVNKNYKDVCKILNKSSNK